jgi:hypothetical protein
MWSLLLSVAFGGDLFVTLAAPGVVRVDGTVLDPIPGMPAVQVQGLTGIHKVEITTPRGAVLQTLNVSVPARGVANLVYDGTRLSLVQAGLDTGGVVPKGPVAMDEATFASLLKAVDQAAFSDDKLDVIRTAATRHHFTIQQLGRIVDALSFSKDQLESVRICQPKITDPENAFALGEHFSFSSDREAALALFR